MDRYFLAQDNSNHWYLVMAEHRIAWRNWCDLPEDDETGWDIPAFAKRIDNPSRIEFERPMEAK